MWLVASINFLCDTINYFKILNITMNFAHGSSLNNVKFKYPTNPLYHEEQDWGITTCPKQIPADGISCTQMMNVDLGDLVELRLSLGLTEIRSE